MRTAGIGPAYTKRGRVFYFRDEISSVYLLDKLTAMDERPWPDYRRGKPLTARQLATLLKPFEIVRGTRREGDDTFKGYKTKQFQNAFSRYLPDKGSQSVTRSQPAFQSHSDENLSVTNSESVTDTKAPKPAPHKACDGVTDRKGGNGQGGIVPILFAPPATELAMRHWRHGLRRPTTSSGS